MTRRALDNWFCSLSVKQKEHIAAKIAMQQGKSANEARYPNSVKFWADLPVENKQQIHDHCTDSHGMWIQEGGDGPFYSY